jgi:hypothetical protein
MVFILEFDVIWDGFFVFILCFAEVKRGYYIDLSKLIYEYRMIY